MNLYPIPFYFIDKFSNLSWSNLKWGYENNLITSDVLIKKAEKKVLTGCYTDTELELSFFIPSDSNHIDISLKKLCYGFEQEDQSIFKKKWLFIILSWLWHNRNKFEDPLAEIEVIYADFGYPIEIENFVKYMPPSNGYDPSIHTYEENINHLMNNWKNYLENNSVMEVRN